MELSCCSTSLMAPTRFSPQRFSSLAFSNSSALSYGGRALSKRSLTFVSCRRSTRGNGRGEHVRDGVRCLFGLGVPELVVIAGVAALVFGPKQLPEIGRNIGKTVKSFQQAAKEFETELKKEPDDGNKPEGPKAVSNQEEGDKELEPSSSKKENA